MHFVRMKTEYSKPRQVIHRSLFFCNCLFILLISQDLFGQNKHREKLIMELDLGSAVGKDNRLWAEKILKKAKKTKITLDMTDALFDAVNQYKVQMAKLLLENGADPNSKDAKDEFFKPINVILRGGRYEANLIKKHVTIMQFLLNYGAESDLHTAAFSGNTKRVEQLLEKGVQPDLSYAWQKNTPLFYASMAGQFDVVRLLIEKKADVKARNEYGYTPLHYILDVKSGKLLLEKGADIKARSNKGRTPLFSAVRWKKIEIAKFLIEHGADINDKENKLGAGLLHVAAIQNNTSMIEFLVGAGVNINATDRENNTPLFYALERRNDEAASMLKKLGAKQKLRD